MVSRTVSRTVSRAAWPNAPLGTSARRILTLVLLVPTLLATAAAHAGDVRVLGLFGSKAVVSVDGGPPTTLRSGQSIGDGTRLLAIEGEAAIFEIDGQRRALRIGQPYVSKSAGAGATVRLSADANGHYMADGTVNGTAMRFMVDTGATVVALPARIARQAGISLLNVPHVSVQTAAGPTEAYQVKLDTISVGALTLHNIDAVVIDRGLEGPLLGNSFLSRMDMRRDGELMVLKKRF
jgi:aspartyl protease family protein